jgi:hypothetical protein
METERDRVVRILQEQIRDAVQLRKLAAAAFEDAAQPPEGFHPDETMRMLKAFREYTEALKGVHRAVKRRSEFITHNIVPDDLK